MVPQGHVNHLPVANRLVRFIPFLQALDQWYGVLKKFAARCAFVLHFLHKTFSKPHSSCIYFFIVQPT